jgi:bacterioferritin-associated ferredoxin
VSLWTSNGNQEDPTLICTCNDLYIDDVEDAIIEGIVEYVEIMQYNDTLPRCGECDCHVQNLIVASNKSGN